MYAVCRAWRRSRCVSERVALCAAGWRHGTLWGTVWLHLALWLFAAASPAPACKANPDLAGKCFVVHGRLRAYNGNPTYRIWPAGTRRLLGVTGAHPGE